MIPLSPLTVMQGSSHGADGGWFVLLRAEHGLDPVSTHSPIFGSGNHPLRPRYGGLLFRNTTHTGPSRALPRNIIRGGNGQVAGEEIEDVPVVESIQSQPQDSVSGSSRSTNLEIMNLAWVRPFPTGPDFLPYVVSLGSNVFRLE